MKIATLLFSMTLATGLAAQAGTWTCLLGLDGKNIYEITMKGDAQAQLVTPAHVVVAGMPGGNLSLYPETPRAGDMAQVVIGAEDPRSKMVLRISFEELSPNVFKAHSLLANFPVKQEFEGPCTFVP